MDRPAVFALILKVDTSLTLMRPPRPSVTVALTHFNSPLGRQETLQIPFLKLKLTLKLFFNVAETDKHLFTVSCIYVLSFTNCTCIDMCIGLVY